MKVSDILRAKGSTVYTLRPISGIGRRQRLLTSRDALRTRHPEARFSPACVA
jgi:hypothetical protein